MNEIEWTNEQVIRLVNGYKNRPELWDPHHNLYRVQFAKYEAWSDLAKIFECDITDLKRKFDSIFASHRREKKKVRSGGRSGWFLYPHMSFLPSHLPCSDDESVEVVKKTRGKKRSVEVSEQSSDDNDAAIVEEITIKEEPLNIQKPPEQKQRVEASEQSSDDDDAEMVEEIIIKDEPLNECYIRPPKQTPKYKYVMQKPRLKRIVRRKVVNEPRQESRSSDSVRVSNNSEALKKKDECDSFGEYIAVSLRKHDERTRSMIKQAINNILFEQEMKKYNTGQYTVVMAAVEENPLMDHGQE